MKKYFYILLSILAYGMNINAQNTDCTTVDYNLTPGLFPQEVSFSVLDSAGLIIFTSTPFNANSNISGTWCLPNGCYTVQMNDSFGDGWNDATLTISVNGGSQYGGSLATGNIGMFNFGVNYDCGTIANVGCMDPNAANFDPSANINGPCDYAGCTDASATNFNPNATIPDSSCVYCNGPGSFNAQLYICTFSNGNEVTLNIVNSAGDTLFTSPVLNNVAIFFANLCLQAGECYTALMSNNAGNLGWNNGYFWISNGTAQVIHTGLADNLSFASANFSMDGTCGEIFGCTDPNALNFNPDATANDNTCQYIYGCTDNLAINYNPQATQNDGSCFYSCSGQLITITSTNSGYIYLQDLVTSISSNIYLSDVNAAPMFCASDNCYYISFNPDFDTLGTSGSALLTDSTGNTWLIDAFNSDPYWSVVGSACSDLTTDLDGDGATANNDCDDSNPSVSPYLPEYPNDGIDNDCDQLIDEAGEGCFVDIIMVPDSLVTNPYEVWVYLPDTGDDLMTYNWSFGDSLGGWSSEAYPSYVYSNIGTYTLCLNTYDSTGCWGYNCITFTMDDLGNSGPGGVMTQPFTLNIINAWPQGNSTAIAERSTYDWSIYPNPTSTSANIQLPKGANGTLRVMSLDGKCVAQEKVTQSNVSLNTESWVAGIYFVQWNNGTDIQSMKLIKE